MKLNLENFKGNFTHIESKLKKIQAGEDPSFSRYNPEIDFFKKALKKYLKYKNIILIGHGGSITSTQGFYGALKNNKKLYVVDTPEPDYINEIKSSCKKRETLVLVVSKSGTNVDILEITMDFLDYKMIIITNPEEGALLEIAKKMNITMIEHPNIGGRFSAFTSSTLVPCHLLGFDIKRIVAGAKEMYKKCSCSVNIRSNPALMVATRLYLEELSGKTEVFTPIYSKKMLEFSNLIVQLMHESSCKEGKGQTFYAASAPESQHHTNQRFFGGKKDVCGFFITAAGQTQKSDKRVNVPNMLKKIQIRNGALDALSHNSYADVLSFEYMGVVEHAKKSEIPHAELLIERCDEYELGEFVAFWQYVAVFASLLREVNPYDQPEVEYAKKISFELRMKN